MATMLVTSATSNMRAPVGVKARLLSSDEQMLGKYFLMMSNRISLDGTGRFINGFASILSFQERSLGDKVRLDNFFLPSLYVRC